jgi:hypothetical protein
MLLHSRRSDVDPVRLPAERGVLRLDKSEPISPKRAEIARLEAEAEKLKGEIAELIGTEAPVL